MNLTLQTVLSWLLPFVFTALAFWVISLAIRKLIPTRFMRRVSRQMLQMLAFVLCTIALLIVLPIDNDTQGQLLSLFGLVITGVIGLASTSFVSNAMAGFMLRTVASFHDGDFVRVGDFFGRVTETALFHTEIQNEERDLVTLPNLYLITHPVEVIRSNGTLISADVSLGYDIHRRHIRDLLIKAAGETDLTDAFVQITELGDYSVNYRVSAFLHDINKLVSTRTALRANMLDQLHEAGIEIVSPAYMNQRPVDPSAPVIPSRYVRTDEDEETGRAEQLMFDKAELAGRVKKIRDQRSQLINEIKELKAKPDTKEYELSWRSRQLDSMDEFLASFENAGEQD